MPIKILIADDHPLIAEGIKNTFDNEEEFQVIAVVENGKEALHFIQKNTVDVALLDIDMPIMDGIACAKRVISEFTEVKVAMLSMHQEASIIKNLVNLGVKGYMLKTIPSDELRLAIKTIYNGKNYFNADVTKALLSSDAPTFHQNKEKSHLINELTSREKEIIVLIANGFTNTQIGDKLYISPRTVDTHRTNIMRKIDVHNVASLIRFAFQNALIS